MSLLSRRRPLISGRGASGNDKDKSSLSQRKPQKPKRFEISRTTLNYPVLGIEGGGLNDSFNLLASPTPASTSSSSSRQFKMSSDSSPFSISSSSSASVISSLSSTGSLYSTMEQRSDRAQEALAASKLNSFTPGGGLEPVPMLSRRKMKRNRKIEKSLTKGAAWYNMAKAEVTKDKKNDLDALKLRSAMDGVMHYKRNNITHTPKYFHVGRVVESSADFYSSRIPKKQRKKTLAQEFASDYGME